MSSKKNINGVVIGVAICCVLFLCYQYFMVYEDGKKLLEENIADRQKMEEQMYDEGNVSQVEEYIQYVRTNGPENANNYDIVAFTHLINALKSLSEKDRTPIVQTKIKTLQQQVDHYENTPDRQKSTQLKAMFAAANSAIQDFDIRQDKRLKAKMEKLNADAAAIDPDASKNELLLQEQAYYRQAADVLAIVDNSF